MYEFGLVALFAQIVEPILSHGVLGRAREREICRLRSVSPRDYATDRHRSVDDRPYGGGPGMVLRYEPVVAALNDLRRQMPDGTGCIALSAQGEPFDQARAAQLAEAGSVILLAARYEGIDERVLAHVDAELSIGDYVLSGGEAAAAVVIDAVTRLLPGVLGDDESAQDDSFMDGLLGYPQYTRPERIDGAAVPPVLCSGDHAQVRRWRLKQALGRTWLRRPDLLERRALSDEERALLEEFQAEHRSARDGRGIA